MTRALAGSCLALLLAACGAPSPSTTPSAPSTASSSAESSAAPPAAPSAAPDLPSTAPTPMANPVATAVTTTSSLGTAMIAITSLLNVEGADLELIGSGPVIFNTGDADLTWQSAAGVSREITSDGAGYVQIDPPSGAWIPLGEGDQVPTLAAGRPLRDLADLAEVHLDGGERINDADVDRYTGWLPARTHLDGLGINDRDALVITDDPRARIRVTVWIDRLGRVVRVMRTLDSSSGIDASSTTDLSDFGASLTVEAPALS